MTTEACEHVAERTVRVDGIEQRSDPYSLLRAARITCHNGAGPHSAIKCLDCARYIDTRVHPDHRTITIRCWEYGGSSWTVGATPSP